MYFRIGTTNQALDLAETWAEGVQQKQAFFSQNKANNVEQGKGKEGL